MRIPQKGVGGDKFMWHTHFIKIYLLSMSLPSLKEIGMAMQPLERTKP